jgi:hypothetical protein
MQGRTMQIPMQAGIDHGARRARAAARADRLAMLLKCCRRAAAADALLLLMLLLPLVRHRCAAASTTSLSQAVINPSSSQPPQSPACVIATERATLAAGALRDHFWNESAGLWGEDLWWENACSLEATAAHALLTQGGSNLTLRKRVGADIHRLYSQTTNMSKGGPTITGYFDDEEWWALGWLRAWELTGNTDYIERTHTIFSHMVEAAWNDSTCGGGLMWQGDIYAEGGRPGNPYKGAITNELFMMMTAKMAQVGPPANRSTYKSWAQKAWHWFRQSGLINQRGLINDGLDQFQGHNQICANNNQTEWTYNQGVVLGALAFLYELQPDPSLMGAWNLRVVVGSDDATLL